MAYVKEITPGVFESYQIQHINLNLLDKEINVTLASFAMVQGTPRQTQKVVTIKNMDELMIDPAWNENSTPPKPAGFDINDANTWGGVDPSLFPMVNDPAKQFFNTAVITDAPGTNLYERLKSGLYTILAQMGEVPPKSEGWIVQ